MRNRQSRLGDTFYAAYTQPAFKYPILLNNKIHQQVITGAVRMRFLIKICMLSAICSFTAQSVFAQNIDLGKYEPLCERVKLNGIKGASGITYNSKTDSFFIVTNASPHIFDLKRKKPPRIYEIKRDQLLTCNTTENRYKYKLKKARWENVYKLKDFDDTEGLAYIADHTFAVIEEKRMALRYVKMEGGELDEFNVKLPITGLRSEENNNKGWEGVAYVAPTKHGGNGYFFVAKEMPSEETKKKQEEITSACPDNKKPRFCEKKLNHSVYNVEENKESKKSQPMNLIPNFDVEKDVRYLYDLSGLYFDNDTNHLLVLSDQSEAVIEVDLTKPDTLSTLEFSDILVEQVPQAEGITMDCEGYIYIVSERAFKLGWPDRSSLLYIFYKPEASEDRCKTP